MYAYSISNYMTVSKKPYSAPLMENTPAVLAEMLCESPGSGSNEEITYEDWTL